MPSVLKLPSNFPAQHHDTHYNITNPLKKFAGIHNTHFEFSLVSTNVVHVLQFRYLHNFKNASK